MPGGDLFFGANNPKSGFMGGAYLGQAAIQKFGADKVEDRATSVVGELPQSDAVPAMRTNGRGGRLQGCGRRVRRCAGHQDRHQEYARRELHPDEQRHRADSRGVPIMVTAINDQAATGMLRAVKQAGREADLIVVGMGADEIRTLIDEPAFVASVGYFPERYGNFLVPLALMELAGKEVPDTVLMTHYMVTDGNVCEFYKDFACSATPDAITFELPEAAYKAHLEADPQSSPSCRISLNLIPTN